MKQKVLFLAVIFFTAVNAANLTAQMTVSGVFDSSASMRGWAPIGAGDEFNLAYGTEQFVNLRFQARMRERGRIIGAVNMFAAAGDPAVAATIVNPNGVIQGENYIAGIELERLHFRLDFDNVDLDGGLMRMPFGFGQVWGSSDFLNPPNPLRPDARPRAVLATSLSWFPGNDLRILGFGAAGRDPLTQDGSGWLAGLSMDQHWRRASFQMLYAFETPQDSSRFGIHRAGLSLKADLGIGFVIDALYTHNHETYSRPTLDALSASAGFDYSFFGGNLIFLAEYLFNGAASSTALGFGGNFVNEHYLYTGFTVRFNNFTNLNLAVISGLSDISFTPVISLNHDIAQGVSLNLTTQIPLDRNSFFGDGNRGELGPFPPGTNAGTYFTFNARLRFRF